MAEDLEQVIKAQTRSQRFKAEKEKHCEEIGRRSEEVVSSKETESIEIKEQGEANAEIGEAKREVNKYEKNTESKEEASAAIGKETRTREAEEESKGAA